MAKSQEGMMSSLGILWYGGDKRQGWTRRSRNPLLWLLDGSRFFYLHLNIFSRGEEKNGVWNWISFCRSSYVDHLFFFNLMKHLHLHIQFFVAVVQFTKRLKNFDKGNLPLCLVANQKAFQWRRLVLHPSGSLF